MKQTRVDYAELQGVHPAYVAKLKEQEMAIRQALGVLGRHDTSVQWSCIDDGSQNVAFRLAASGDRNDSILQVSPLDLTLTPEQFKQMLAEGKRSYFGRQARGPGSEAAMKGSFEQESVPERQAGGCRPFL